MMLKVLIAVFGGSILSALSTLNRQIVSDDQTEKGFPFSFIDERPAIPDTDTPIFENQFGVTPAVANLLFWAVVAIIVFKLLSWLFEKLSLLAFLGVVLALLASYFGLFQIF